MPTVRLPPTARRLALGLAAAGCLAAALASAPGFARAEGSVVVIPGIRIGVVGGERLAAASARLEPFRKRMAAEIGTSVEIVPLKDGLTLIDAIATKRVDYAVLSASAYAAAWRVCGCVEPAAAPRSLDGTGSYRSVLLVRSGAAAGRIEDLKGAAVAAADAASVAGRLVPFAELAASGFDPREHFGRVETASGPEAAVRLLVAGKVDAAFAWSSLEGDAATGYSRGTLHDMVERGRLDMAAVRIVWRSNPIPHGPHAIRTDLSPYVKTRIRETLLRLRDDDPDAYEAVEPAFGGGFAPVAHADYAALLALVTPRARPADKTARPPG